MVTKKKNPESSIKYFAIINLSRKCTNKNGIGRLTTPSHLILPPPRGLNILDERIMSLIFDLQFCYGTRCPSC